MARFVRQRLNHGILSLAVLLLLIVPAFAAAQATGGVITGLVADAQGGALPGVTVTIRNVDSGTTRVVVTEANGRYRAAALEPGPYSVKGELAGFSNVEVGGLTVTIGTELTRNLMMQLSGFSENVTVTEQTPVVETTKTDISGVITQQQIEALPLATRQPVALALLMPGTSQDATRPRKFNANVGAGAFTNAGAFLIDGVWNKEPCTGEPRQNYPQGAVQEFKVNVSQATAEYGWTASGVVAFATKSGTNQLHGEGFEFFRDKSLNRMNIYEQQAYDKGAAKPGYQRNQYGVSLGGPIIKDRLHFFFTAERLNEQKYLTVNTGLPQFYSSLEGTFPVPEYDNTWFGRGDLQISQKQHVFLRYAGERADYTSDNSGGNAAWFTSNGINQPRGNWTGGHTWVISNRALNEIRGQYSYYGYYPHPPGVKSINKMFAYPPERTAGLSQTYSFPSLSWGTASNMYVFMRVSEIRDDFSITANKAGSHTLKFGGAITVLPNWDDVPGSPGGWRFTKDQPFDPTNPAIMMSLTGANQYTQTLNTIERYLPSQYNEVYTEDEWKPASNVTLNLGLRYDIQTRIWNNELNINDKTLFPTTGTPTQIPYVDFQHRGDRNNIGPRLAASWDIGGDGKSVARAGWGIYYNPMFSTNARGEQTNFRQLNVTITNPTFPGTTSGFVAVDPYKGQSPAAFASTAPQNISITANDLRNPTARATTVGFSRALTSTIGLHLDGVFNQITGVPMGIQINERDGFYNTTTGAFVATGVRPLPQFARISQIQSIGDAHYQALLVRLERQFDRRYQYLISYTLAKGEGNVSFTGPSGNITEFANPGADRGPAPNDRRHVLIGSGTVLLPGGVQFGGVYTYRTTGCFSAAAGKDIGGDTSTSWYVPGTTRCMGNRDNATFLAAVNAWRALPSNGSLAPIPMSQLTTNQYNSLDVRVSKQFPLHNQQKLEVFAQVFNLLGSNNLLASGGTGGWTTNALSDSFGRILTALNRQQTELALRIIW